MPLLKKHVKRQIIAIRICGGISRYNWLQFIFIFWICASSCENPQRPPENLLATVGEKIITVDDFISRVEMTPHPQNIIFNGKDGNGALLEMLIGEKLLAISAEKQGLQYSDDYKTRLEFIESQAVVRELYHDEVLDRIVVSESEIERAFARQHKTLTLKYFAAKDRRTAEAFRRDAEKFHSFDAAIRARTTGVLPLKNCITTLTWGVADEAL